MATILLLVVLAVVLFWGVGAYNGLISLKNQVQNGWTQIDVQLKRRHDLIPNLVNTVKGAMEYERGTMEAVVSARAKAMGAQGVKATAEAEGQLTQALGKLFALMENYPDLKATANVLQLQEELTSTENRIGFSPGSTTTTSPPSTTPRSSSSPPTSWRASPRRRRPTSGSLPMPASARCRPWTCPPAHRACERRQPLRAAGGQPPPVGVAGRRVRGLLRLGRIRRRLRLLPPDRRRPARRVSPCHPLHRPADHRRGRAPSAISRGRPARAACSLRQGRGRW